MITMVDLCNTQRDKAEVARFVLWLELRTIRNLPREKLQGEEGEWEVEMVKMGCVLWRRTGGWMLLHYWEAAKAFVLWEPEELRTRMELVDKCAERDNL